ncbi:unnamed protein product [Didymodactylos carnosus]|uniref:ADP ribosyltransferase domain-containing protein n=2 Tax=Didymodactylos carnosus TaxID=1234261 RepID=A0A8S2ES91_9BILA|nr:unnamed protein product [Didymodactylos carnosus]CAF4034334.1 unnamed protein product [Didymodactylos carnosus]
MGPDGLHLLPPPSDPTFPLHDIDVGDKWTTPIMNALGELEYKLINADGQVATLEFDGGLNMFSGGLSEEIQEQCVKFYTAESFLYRLVNMTLRKDDRNKLIGATFEGRVYRGAQLDEQMLRDYKNSVSEVRKWLGYSSTSKNRRLAENFGNTLFIIKTIKTRENTNWDVSLLSEYPNEDELLLTAGISFTINKVECNGGKYLIYLTVKRGWH